MILKGVAGAALGVVVGPPIIVAGLGALGFGTAGVAAGNVSIDDFSLPNIV